MDDAHHPNPRTSAISLARNVTCPQCGMNWGRLSTECQELMGSLELQLLPVHPITPSAPEAPIWGFECRPLGPHGMLFAELERHAHRLGLDEFVLRAQLLAVAIDTVQRIGRTWSRVAGIGRQAKTCRWVLWIDRLLLRQEIRTNRMVEKLVDGSVPLMLLTAIEIREEQVRPFITMVNGNQLAGHGVVTDAGMALSSRMALAEGAHFAWLGGATTRAYLESIGDAPPQVVVNFLRNLMLPTRPLVVGGLDDPRRVEQLAGLWPQEVGTPLLGQGAAFTLPEAWRPLLRPLPGEGYAVDFDQLDG